MKVAGALGLCVLLFVLVYVPVFALLSAAHVSKQALVPSVIIGTMLTTVATTGFYGWRNHFGPAHFGMRTSAARYLGYALLISTPLAVLAAAGAEHFHEPGSLQGLVLTPAETCLYFVLAAPLQEEAIFRGLLQTVLADQLRTTAGGSAVGISSVAATGLLFGLIHLAVGPFTAASALILGLVAGELRRRSASLLPAILSHAVFNCAPLLLP